MEDMQPDLTGELSRAAEAAMGGITARAADLDTEIDDPTLEADPDTDGATDDDAAVDDANADELVFADV